MKENQNKTAFDSISFGQETDSLAFGGKDRCELNDSRMDAKHSELEAKDRDDCLNCKDMDQSSVDSEKGTMDSPKKASQNGLSHHLSIWDKDADSISSDSSDIDKEQRCPLFTDKNVMECDTPELEVFYKEIDSQILKDICVDEGRPQKDINEMEQCKTQKAEGTGEAYIDATGKAEYDSSEDKSIVDRKLPIEDIDTQSSLGFDGGNMVMQVPDKIYNQEAAPPESLAASSADTGGTKEDVQASCLFYNSKVENGSITFNFRTPEGAEAGKGITEDGEEQSAESGDVHKDINSENLPDASEEKVQCTSNRVGALPGNCITEDVEEQYAKSGDVHKDVNSKNLPDASEETVQCTSDRVGAVPGNGISEDVEEQSAETGDMHNGVNSGNLPDASEEKVQCTSNRAGAVPGNGIAEDVEEQSSKSGAVHNDCENLPDASKEKVQGTSDRVGDSSKQSPIDNEGDSDGDSASCYVQSVGGEDSSCGNDHQGSPRHKSDVVSIDAPVQSPTNKSPAPTNDVKASEENAPNLEEREEVPVVNPLQHDMGETSFSAASMIAYSGPIAFSGSLSHRSDGSTTSGKSFAFPVLQSEWNQSPVRMAKAERRHFRKHKGWRSGLLCCRF